MSPTWTRLAENCWRIPQESRGVRVVGRLNRIAGQTRTASRISRVLVIAEHVEFKPQMKKDGEPAVDGEQQEAAEVERVEVKEAASV